MPAFLRPGEGFKSFVVLEKKTKVSKSGSVGRDASFEEKDQLKGILATTSPKERETWKQNGYEVSNHIVSKGKPKAAKNQYLYFESEKRIFRISEVKNPAGLGHCTIYYVQEREDLQYVPERVSSAGDNQN